MDGLLATVEMEYNGIYVNQEHGEKLRQGLVEDITEARELLEGFIPELPPELTFNWGSPVHKSCLIFGGTVRYDKWVQHTDEHGNLLYAQKDEAWPKFSFNNTTYEIPPDKAIKAGELYVVEVPKGTAGSWEHKDKSYITQDTFKGGKNVGKGKFKNNKVPDTTKPKGRLTDHFFTFDGYTKPKPSWKGESTDAWDGPLYSVAAEVIDELEIRKLPFTKALAKHTKLTKDLSTYYWAENKKGKRKGMLTLVQPDGIIHHKLNLTSTVTSRMSSSDPNMQTLPRGRTSDVKQMFESRFEDGEMSEIDYSQLEVVIQAVLSGDKQMIKDLNAKVDFHCKRLAIKEHKTYEEVVELCKVLEIMEWVDKRTGAKVFSFQRAYGAGVEAVMHATGMSKAEVEALIAAEEATYPMLKKFDEMLEKHIYNNAYYTKSVLFVNGVAFKQMESYWEAPTGTRYTWRTGVTPDFMHKHGKYTGFSPPERKNYPVQGFGGEIVQTMLGKVFRYFIANDRFNGDVLMVNTVHDCMILDGKKGKTTPVAKECQKILESVPELFNSKFDKLNITVPFPCETEVGNNLFEMKTVH